MDRYQWNKFLCLFKCHKTEKKVVSHWKEYSVPTLEEQIDGKQENARLSIVVFQQKTLERKMISHLLHLETNWKREIFRSLCNGFRLRDSEIAQLGTIEWSQSLSQYCDIRSKWTDWEEWQRSFPSSLSIILGRTKYSRKEESKRFDEDLFQLPKGFESTLVTNEELFNVREEWLAFLLKKFRCIGS